jgi:tetratricopeptide (TPR) repeat protein
MWDLRQRRAGRLVAGRMPSPQAGRAVESRIATTRPHTRLTPFEAPTGIREGQRGKSGAVKVRGAWICVITTTLWAPFPAARADESTIAGDIAALGDLKPATREAAAAALGAMGRDAEPALQAASSSDDPEVAERASAILERFRFGLSPASPRDLVKLLAQYRTGPDALRTEALTKLASSDLPGMRILAGLAHETSNASMRDLILAVMGRRPRDAAALLLANEDRGLAERVLSNASDAGDPEAARDLAAFESLNGGLAAEITAIKARTTKKTIQNSDVVLAYLDRAAGDLPGAQAAAERSGNDRLVNSILVDQQKWAELARRISSWDDPRGSLEKLGYLAYCQRLAGNMDGFSQSVRGIVAFADTHTTGDNVKIAARTLCVNDEPDLATDVLARHNEFDLAAALLIHRLKLREALAVLRSAHGLPPAQQVRLRIWEAEVYLREGNKDSLAASLAEAVKLAEAINDADAWDLLARIAREGADRAHADEYLARALAFSTRGRGVSLMLTAAGVAKPAMVEQWWWFLRPKATGDDLLPTARRVIDLSKERAPSPKLIALAHELQTAAEQFPNRSPLTLLAAGTLLGAGVPAEAESYLAHSAVEIQTPAMWMQLAEVQESLGEWKQAASSYDRAWDIDRTLPVPLFLEGLALRQAGNSAAAQKLIDMAHLIPLANDAARGQLLTACEEHHSEADAARERDILIRTGDSRGPERIQALGSAGAAAAKARGSDAMRLLEAAIIEHSAGRAAFIDELQTIRFAGLIDAERATVALHGGDVKGALAFSQKSEEIDPLAGDELFDLIEDFVRSGHRAEAEALRMQAEQVFRNLLKDFPNSANLENDLAWLLGHTGGNLDEALTLARRATALDPNGAGIADTLADVYFRRGETPEAIETMQKCVELEPNEPSHRERLEAFRRALAGQTSPPQTQSTK